jgi:hypothetical protein
MTHEVRAEGGEIPSAEASRTIRGRLGPCREETQMRPPRAPLLLAFVMLAATASPALGKIECLSPVTLWFDLETGAVSGNARCVRYGGSVTVVVENVNTFLYDVEINGQRFESDVELAPSLETLVVPELPDVAPPSRDGRRFITDEGLFGERLAPLRDEGSFDDAVGLYVSAVRELYLIADDLERRIRIVVYGSPTPRPDRVRRDALLVARDLLGIDGDDPTTVSNRILLSGFDALQRVDTLHGVVIDLEPRRMTDGQRAAMRSVGASRSGLARDREAILDRFRVASEMLLRLDETRFTVASAPMLAQGEAFPIRVSVTPRDDLPPGASLAYELPEREVANLLVGGGFTVGASAGVTFSSPVDGEYGTITDPSSGDEILVRKGDEAAFTVGVDVMAHVYQRKPGDVNHAIALGLGANQGGGLQFLLGYGVMLGRRQRIVISAGGIGSEVRRLADGFEEGDVLPAGTPIPTEDRIALGFYVGATYRFWAPGIR